MTATGTAVRVRGLRKIYRPARYREVAALNGLDLDIGTGEIVALLGPNGAGKTTTVQILTGFRRRDAGEVTVLGTDPAAADRAWRARLGIVPQQASDFGELTVGEVVRHLAGYYPDPHDCAELIDAVGLTGQASTRLRRLDPASRSGWASRSGGGGGDQHAHRGPAARGAAHVEAAAGESAGRAGIRRAAPNPPEALVANQYRGERDYLFIRWRK
jgi:ABC-type transport system involved in cytochrome bd biosynthesis fused ATPase/permease subunit